MIVAVGTALPFRCYFTASKTGKTGLTVTVDVRNPAGTEIITAAAATEIGDGIYQYTLAAGSVTTSGPYTAIFKTADATVDVQHVPAQWIAVGTLDLSEAEAGDGLSNTLNDLLWMLRIRLNDTAVGAYPTRDLTLAINLAYRDAVVAAKCRKTTKSIALVAGTHTYDCAEIFEPIEVALGTRQLTPKTIGGMGISLERWNAEPQGEPTEWVPLNGGNIRIHKTPSAIYSTTGPITTLTTAPVAGGTGYAVNDTLTITDGTASGGTARVTAVSAGVVTAVELMTSGAGYSTGTKATTTDGDGTGATLDVSAVSVLTVHGLAHPVALVNGSDTPDSLPDGYSVEVILDGAESYSRSWRPTVSGNLSRAKELRDHAEMWWGKIRESTRG